MSQRDDLYALSPELNVLVDLGLQGSTSPVGAGVSLCPAYDIRTAFYGLGKRYPRLDRYLTAGMLAAFCGPAKSALLSQYNPSAFADCQAATGMHEFMVAAAPFSGALDFEDFCAKHNPMSTYPGIACPVRLFTFGLSAQFADIYIAV